MSDDLNFDEDDELLLNVDFSEDESFIPVKRISQTFVQSCVSKKPKLDDSWDSETSPTSLVNQQNSENTKCYTPNTAKRLFPGPAGLFSDENVSIASSHLEICSQRTTSVLKDGPWEEMSKDFKISNSLYLYDRFNIAWIKREANANAFAIHKVPFLAGVLVSLEVSKDQKHKSVNVTLKDFTGTIQGNILYSLYEQHASFLIHGAVLILVQFGVLSCSCDKCDNHHLTINSKNLSAIYRPGEKTVINKILPQKVIIEYENRHKKISRCSSDNDVCKRDLKNLFLAPNCQKKCIVESSLFSNKLTNDININEQLDDTHKPLFTLKNNSTIFQNSEISDFLQNSNRQKCKPSAFDKSEINCDKKVNSSSEAKKMFTFKKTLPKMVDNICDLMNDDNNIQISSKPKDDNNSSQDSRETDSVEYEEMWEKALENVGNEPKKLFTFKATLPRAVDNICDLMNSDNNIQIFPKPNDDNNSSQVSIKTDTIEHENIWKEALENVDLNSFFEDDF